MLSLAAGVGLLQFPDLLSRMHVGTKPQVLRVLLTVTGAGPMVRSGLDVGILVLMGVFQMVTIPGGAHMVDRAAYRTRQIQQCHLFVNELENHNDG